MTFRALRLFESVQILNGTDRTILATSRPSVDRLHGTKQHMPRRKAEHFQAYISICTYIYPIIIIIIITIIFIIISNIIIIIAVDITHNYAKHVWESAYMKLHQNTLYFYYGFS